MNSRRLLLLASLSSLACTPPMDGNDTLDTAGTLTIGDAATASDTATATATATMTSDSSESESGDEAKLDLGASDLPTELPEVAEVFGHSGSVLYRLDPTTLQLEEVGPFAPCAPPSIIDIALDANSNMYGTAFGALWRIDRESAECTLVTEEGSFPTSLSFLPAEIFGEEVLVGYDDADYLRIDPSTGAIEVLGALGDGLESSGDVVSVVGKTYLTVRGPGCDATDCIVEIDPSSGQVTKNYGSVGYDQVFGLGFWGGKAYGFAREGALFEIEFLDDSVITTEVPIPNAPPGLEWFGAGSTTAAPPLEG